MEDPEASASRKGVNANGGRALQLDKHHQANKGPHWRFENPNS